LILKFLVNSNLFVSLCVLILTWGTAKVSQQEISIFHLLFVGSSTWLVYNLHRYFGGRMTTEFSQKPFVVESKKQALLRSALPFVVIAFCLFKFSTNDFLVLIPAGLISIFYVGDLFLKRTNTGLRSIPFIKIFLIALVWSIVTVGFPLKAQLFEWKAVHLILFIERFFFILAITIPFDIRDLGIDNRGLRTIPQILGIQKAKYFSYALLLIAGICSILLWNQAYYTNQLMIALVGIYIFTGVLLLGVNKNKPDLYYSFGIEGTMLILGAVLILLG